MASHRSSLFTLWTGAESPINTRPTFPTNWKSRMKPHRILLTLLVTGMIARAQVPPPASTPTPLSPMNKTEEGKAMLLGEWRFTYPPRNWAGRRIFQADGTLTGEGFGGVGKWTLSNNIVHIEYPKGDQEEMQLPLNPAGMKVRAQNGKVTVTAVKLTGDSKAPGTTPQAKP